MGGVRWSGYRYLRGAIARGRGGEGAVPTEIGHVEHPCGDIVVEVEVYLFLRGRLGVGGSDRGIVVAM